MVWVADRLRLIMGSFLSPETNKMVSYCAIAEPIYELKQLTASNITCRDTVNIWSRNFLKKKTNPKVRFWY